MGRTLTAILGTACCLALSACSRESVAGPPETTPTPSTSISTPSTTSMSPSTTSVSTPSTSPTTTGQEPPTQPPRLPALAKEKSSAGAKAFVQYYIEVLNSAWATESSASIRKNAADGCKVCAGLAGLVDSVSRRGGYQHGGLWTPVSMFSVPTQPDDKPILITKIQIARGSWLKSAGSTPEPIRAKSVAYDFYLEWRGSRWVVADIKP